MTKNRVGFGFFAACGLALLAGCNEEGADAGSTGSGTTSSSGSTGSSSTTGTTGSTGGSTTSGGSTTGGSTTSGSGSTTSGGTTGATIGTPCVPVPVFVLETTCAPSGYFCQGIFDLDGGEAASGTCQLPIEYAQCLETVGCAPPSDGGPELACTQGFGASGRTSLCVYPCQLAADCPDLFSTCLGGRVCFVTPCGPGFTDGGFYDLCNNAGFEDGVCLPFTSNYFGLCYGGRTAPIGGPCSPTRTNGGAWAAQTCPKGGVCQVGSDGGSACYRATTTYFPDCVGVAPESPAPPDLVGPPSWELCLSPCDAGPGPTDCTSGQACLGFDGGVFACFPP